MFKTFKKTILITAILMLGMVMITACNNKDEIPVSETNNIANQNIVANNRYISDEFKNPHLTTPYNTQEHLGYWSNDFLNIIGANYNNYFVRTNGTTVDMDATFINISNELARFLHERTGEIFSTETLFEQMKRAYEGRNNNNRIDISEYDLSNYSNLFVDILSHQIVDVLNEDNILPKEIIESMKATENNIHSANIINDEKEMLFAITASVKYSTAHSACLMEPNGTMDKAGNKLLSSGYCCCCGAGCYCYNATREMIDVVGLGSLIGGVLAAPGGFHAWLIGNTTGGIGTLAAYVILKEGWW